MITTQIPMEPCWLISLETGEQTGEAFVDGLWPCFPSATPLHVVLPHLLGEIFRAIVVNVSRLFPDSFGSFRQCSTGFS